MTIQKTDTYDFIFTFLNIKNLNEKKNILYGFYIFDDLFMYPNGKYTMRVDGNYNNIIQSNKPLKPLKTFELFGIQNSSYPAVPSIVSRAYAAPVINPEYKQLDTFKLKNTGEGKIYKLRNGHRVIVLPKKGPTVINTYINTGWAFEKPDKRETAHLLEHLLATPAYKKNAAELKTISSDISADTNAMTSNYNMHYFCKATVFDDTDLEKLIKIQYETLLNPDFNEENIKQEQKTIIQESLEHGKQKTIYSQMDENAIKTFLNLDNTDKYSFTINDNPYAVNNVTENDLRDFYKKYYTPANMSTVIIGNVDDNTIKTFSKYFSRQKTPVMPQNYREYKELLKEPPEKSIRTDLESIDPEQNRAIAGVAFLAKSPNTPKEQACYILAKTLITDRLLNNSNCFSLFNEIPLTPLKNSPFMLQLNVFLEPGKEEQTIQYAYDVMYDIANRQVQEFELKQAADKYAKYDDLQKEESTMALSDILGEYFMKNDDASQKSLRYYLQTVTPLDIQNYFKQCFNPNKTSLTVIRPKKQETKISFKGNIDISDCIKPKEYFLPNNVHVLYDESDDILKTNIRFVLTSGTQNKTDLKALQYLVNAAISGATGEYSINNDIYFKTETTSEKHILRFTGEPENTKKMIDAGIFELLHPNLADFQNFENWKNEQIKSIEESKDKEKNIANLYNNEFFNDAPWLAKKTDIKNLTLYDTQNFYNNLVKNGQLSVLVTIPKSSSLQYKNYIFSALSSLPAFKPYNYNEYFNIYSVAPFKENKIFIEKNNRDTISIKKDYKIIRTGNIKDMAALNVLHIILGADDNGLLFNDLRTDKQISYGAYTKLINNTAIPKLSRLLLHSATPAQNPENLKTVLESFDNCTKKLQNELIDEKTLKRAKRKFKSNIFNDCDISSSRNFYLELCSNSFYGAKFFEELEKAVDELTPYDIQQIAKYYFSQPAIYSISGNSETIEKNMDYLKTLGRIVE